MPSKPVNDEQHIKIAEIQTISSALGTMGASLFAVGLAFALASLVNLSEFIQQENTPAMVVLAEVGKYAVYLAGIGMGMWIIFGLVMPPIAMKRVLKKGKQ